MPPRYTIRQVVGTYRRKAFGTERRPPYPADAIVAFYGLLELAEEQPRRGHFESERLLRTLLEGPDRLGRRYARQVPYLIDHGDLVPTDDGGLDVEGWDLIQEGSDPIRDRMGRFNGREHRPLTGAERTAKWRKQRQGRGDPDSPDDVTAVTSQPCDDGDGDGSDDGPRTGDVRPQRRGSRLEGEGFGVGGGSPLPGTRELVSVGDVLGSALRAATTTRNGGKP